MGSLDSVVLGLRVVLAAVFVLAAVGKLLDLPGSRAALASFGVPARAARLAGTVLPFIELAVAAALIPADTATLGAASALLLLLCFLAGIAHALVRGRAPDCHCFGKLHSAPVGRVTLVRNIALALLAGFIVVSGPGAGLPAWIDARNSAELTAVAAVIAAGLLGAHALGLRLENRRLTGQLESVLAQTRTAPAGLAVGAPAPAFALPGVDGQTVTLQALRARGLPVALLFVEEKCGPCQAVLADLGRWQTALSPAVTITAITRGRLEDNLRLAQQHRIAHMLVQQDGEVADAYRIHGTPSAVIVNPDGTIARPPAAGAPAIEALIRLITRPASPGASPGARIAAPLPT